MTGVPQIPITIEAESKITEGRLVFEVTDASNNSQVYTLCYYYNISAQNFEFEITTGINNACLSSPQFVVGIFGKYSLNYHRSNFSETDNLSFPGTTTDASGNGGYFGIYVGKKISGNFAFNGKLSLDNYGGILDAPDSVLSSIRDINTGELLPYQETHKIELKSLFLNLSIGADYTFLRNLYANLALNFAMRLNNQIEVNKKINIPDGYEYSNGSDIMKIAVEELNTLSSIRLGLSFGLGVNIPINRYINPFIEAHYNYFPFNIIDKDWTINSLSLIFGFKYKI